MQDSRTETTIRAYDRHAAKFADKFRDYKPYQEKIEAFQQRFIPAGAVILDVGCGPGINAKILLQTISGVLKAGGGLYLCFMEGKTAGFETTSFSADRLYFNYHSREVICTALRQNAIEPLEVYTADYPEEDGSFTRDVFIFGEKQP